MSDDFVFSMTAKKVRKTDGQILESLHQFAIQNGMKYFTTIKYDGWDEKLVGSTVISERFGSWKKALILIGVEGARERKYSDKELMDNLESVWRECGYPPGKRIIAQFGQGISESPYKDRWGSLKTACELLSKYKSGAIEWSVVEKLSSASQMPETDSSISLVRKSLSLDLRFRILKRDNFKCVKCGNSPSNSHDVELHVDHITPFSKGGNNDMDNLQTLCSRCNLGKSNRHSV
jgi:hypothetical protein